MKLKGSYAPGIKIDKAGKVQKIDSGARHPVVRARRQRNKGKVTGVRPAK